MKSSDPLLEAWRKTLARKGDTPAIFDTNGAALRSFRQIEEEARANFPESVVVSDLDHFVVSRTAEPEGA